MRVLREVIREHLKVGFLDYMGAIFNFLRNLSILFSLEAVSIDIPTNSAPEFLFLHVLTNIFNLWAF